MYKKGIYEIVSNEPLTASVYRMVVAGDTQYLTASGQFVNIEVPGKFLRRPISVCDYDERTITLIYKVVGEGNRTDGRHEGRRAARHPHPDWATVSMRRPAAGVPCW